MEDKAHAGLKSQEIVTSRKFARTKDRGDTIRDANLMDIETMHGLANAARQYGLDNIEKELQRLERTLGQKMDEIKTGIPGQDQAKLEIDMDENGKPNIRGDIGEAARRTIEDRLNRDGQIQTVIQRYTMLLNMMMVIDDD